MHTSDFLKGENMRDGLKRTAQSPTGFWFYSPEATTANDENMFLRFHHIYC